MTTKDEQGSVSTDVASLGPDPLSGLIEYARSIQPESDDEVQRRILDNILRAQSPAELLNAGSSMPAEQIAGHPLRIEEIRAAESTQADGMDMYLHVDATLLRSGDRVTFSTGSRDVVVKLLLASRNGWLPMNAKLVKADKPTAAGYYPMFIRPLADNEEPF